LKTIEECRHILKVRISVGFYANNHNCKCLKEENGLAGPFSWERIIADCGKFWRADVEDVRTLWANNDPAILDMVAKIRELDKLIDSPGTKLAA
jgi:hypothetical protein